VNALLSEVHIGQTRRDQVELPLAAEGVLRYVWESRFGPVLIEVKEGRAYVNGQAVQSAEPGIVERHATDLTAAESAPKP
jgi:hypothetical protein